MAYYGMCRERVRFFPNTVDVHGIAARVDELRGDRAAIRRSLGVESAFAALFVGRLIAAKAPLELLEAYRRVCERRSDCALLIVGDGELEGELREGIAEHGLRGARLLGFRQGEELLAVYAAADLFVLPSRQEPWGVVVNEAAAAGLPLLVSDAVGAGRDLVEPGGNGEVVGAGDVDGLTERWLALLDSGRLEEMGARSRAIVSHWDYDFAIGEFRAAAREALG